MPPPTRSPVEKAASEEVAHEEVGERPQVTRHSVIEPLVGIASPGDGHVGLAPRVIAVLRLPIRKRHKRVIDKPALHLIVAPMVDDQMLVHFGLRIAGTSSAKGPDNLNLLPVPNLPAKDVSRERERERSRLAASRRT